MHRRKNKINIYFLPKIFSTHRRPTLKEILRKIFHVEEKLFQLETRNFRKQQTLQNVNV